MDQEIVINRVSTFSEQLAKSIGHLVQQLGDDYEELTDDDLIEMLRSPNHNLFVAETTDGKIVGMVLVMVYRIPFLRKAYMEDLAVDEAFRGKGIGTRLLQHALVFAKEHGAAYIDFTSHPSRVAGNTLYEKLGIQKRTSNVYRKVFHDGKTK